MNVQKTYEPGRRCSVPEKFFFRSEDPFHWKEKGKWEEELSFLPFFIPGLFERVPCTWQHSVASISLLTEWDLFTKVLCWEAKFESCWPSLSLKGNLSEEEGKCCHLEAPDNLAVPEGDITEVDTHRIHTWSQGPSPLWLPIWEPEKEGIANVMFLS